MKLQQRLQPNPLSSVAHRHFRCSPLQQKSWVFIGLCPNSYWLHQGKSIVLAMWLPSIPERHLTEIWQLPMFSSREWPWSQRINFYLPLCVNSIYLSYINSYRNSWSSASLLFRKIYDMISGMNYSPSSPQMILIFSFFYFILDTSHLWLTYLLAKITYLVEWPRNFN